MHSVSRMSRRKGPMMKTPEYIRQGDRIALVAPAGRIDREVVRKASETLRSWGLEVEIGKHVFDDHYQYSATDPDRLADLQKALDDPAVKAVLCARGGYGTIRIIDRIDFKQFGKHPKWIIGFSDITALHAHVNGRLGTESIHGGMAAGIAGGGTAAESLRAALTGERLHYSLATHALSKKGQAKGMLVGGNLAIIAALAGSPSELQTDGRILFIEEVGEHLYRIDRMMWALRRAGKLEHLAGLIVGGMTGIPDSPDEFGQDAFGIIREHIEAYDFPACFGFPAGHQEDNRALVLGRTIALEVGDTTEVAF